MNTCPECGHALQKMGKPVEVKVESLQWQGSADVFRCPNQHVVFVATDLLYTTAYNADQINKLGVVVGAVKAHFGGPDAGGKKVP